jgi:predicted GNAT family acetyltransferase
MDVSTNLVKHDASKQCFTTEVDGLHAELAYAVSGEFMTITHTFVPPAISGRGIAAQLMRAALSVARAQRWTVHPACSYAAAYLRKFPYDPDKEHLDCLLDEALDESFPASDSPAVGGSD